MDIQKEINEARKSGDKIKLGVLQGLKSAIDNAKLRKGSINSEFSDLEVISVIRTQIKQRRESSTAYRVAGRIDLALKEDSESLVLEEYLPKELSLSELTILVDSSISEVGASSKKDAGKVIKLCVEKASGRASNQEISAMVMSKLS